MVKRAVSIEIGLKAIIIVFDFYRCHNLTLIFCKSFDDMWMHWCWVI